MKTATLREKLHELINNVSDKNLPLVYQAIDSAVSPASNWWEDKNVIREFDDRIKSWLDNEKIGYSMDDIDQEINKRKKIK